jgi:ribonuclease BN (tRNA processing enzyme)
MQEMKLVFYGVRGSYPVSGKEVIKYGGNTSSILIETDDKPLVLDAGTGIISIGNLLQKKMPQLKKIDIFLTHYHIDHIQGIPFFKPVYDPGFEIDIYSFENQQNRLEETIYSLFNPPLSPVGINGIKAKINFNILDLNQRKTISIGKSVKIDYIKENHPIAGVIIYRVSVEDKRIVYATDVESPDGFSRDTMNFIKGADVLIHDSMYFDDDYNAKDFSKKGFGHSTVTMAAANAVKGEVKKLFLFHYNPDYSDRDILKMQQEARKTFKNTFLSEESKGYDIK